MFNRYRNIQFPIYAKARAEFIEHPERLIRLENYLTGLIKTLLEHNREEIRSDYDEATYLFPFWQNYPPSERGRKPKGDQYPWIEIGEHVIGSKLSRWLTDKFTIRDSGIPTGPDERFVLQSNELKEILRITDGCWLFIDIKSVGPRDDFPHAVMSHNQITGSGEWNDLNEGVVNQPLLAKGKRNSHPFYCAIPPIYVLSSGLMLPVVTVIIKPVYNMLSLDKMDTAGQTLNRIDLATIPNGILLTENPNYLLFYPSLFFPGKDDKTKKLEKLRARVSFKILQEIDQWRYSEISLRGTNEVVPSLQ